MLTRKAFLARSALLVGSLSGLKALAPGESLAVGPTPVPHPSLSTGRANLIEWWVQNDRPDPMEARLYDSASDKIVHSIIVPPNRGVVFTYPLGREPQADTLTINGEQVMFERLNLRRIQITKERTHVQAHAASREVTVGMTWEE